MACLTRLEISGLQLVVFWAQEILHKLPPLWGTSSPMDVLMSYVFQTRWWRTASVSVVPPCMWSPALQEPLTTPMLLAICTPSPSGLTLALLRCGKPPTLLAHPASPEVLLEVLEQHQHF